MEDDGLLEELQEELGSDYSPQLRLAARMLSGDAQAAVPYLLFSIAKSLEDVSFLLANDSISVVKDADEQGHGLPRFAVDRPTSKRWAVRSPVSRRRTAPSSAGTDPDG